MATEVELAVGTVGLIGPMGLAGQRERFAAAYRVLQAAIAEEAFPGCAFSLMVGGEVVVADALGQFTYEPDSPPMMVETRFDVASLTKVAATTAAAMLLWQRGQLDLEMPLGELLPGFVIGRPPAERSREVTVRHLLAHSSGLPGYRPLWHQCVTPFALLRACLELPLEAIPGQRAEYSDHGFILLNAALEAILRQSPAVWVNREIFAPLGMTASGFCPPTGLRAMIPPTEKDRVFRQRRIQGEVQDEHAFVMRGAGGHAGLFSTVGDLLRLAGEILRPGRLFTAETVATFAERQGPAGSSRALGWDTPSENSSSGRYFGPGSIGHLGYSGCSLWIDRAAEVAVVLLTNRTWPDRQSEAIRQVRPAFHDALREAL